MRTWFFDKDLVSIAQSVENHLKKVGVDLPSTLTIQLNSRGVYFAECVTGGSGTTSPPNGSEPQQTTSTTRHSKSPDWDLVSGY